MDIRVLVLPELPAMIITIASVFILYLILKKFLHGPISDFLAARQEKIKADMDQARLSREEANQMKIDYENSLLGAKSEGQEIIENSRRRGAEIREGIIEEARVEAQAIIDRARKEIVREKEKAYEDIKASAGELAVLIASKLIEEQINTENQERLIDKFIDEVGSAKWQS